MSYCKKCGTELPEGSAYCPKCGTPTQSAAEPAFRPAYWGERFVAWLIDIAILGAISALIGFFLWAGWPSYGLVQGFPNWIPFVNFGSSNVVHFLYWMLMDGIYGQSLGKMIMKIKVVQLDGARVDMPQAALESVGKAFLLPFDCLLGWILYPSKGQRLFNYLSNTIVVKA